MRQLFRRAWYAIRQRRHEADLTEEMECHRAMKQRELEHEGLETSSAERAARRVLGNTTIARDRSRDVWLPRWFQQIGQDVRYAFRTFRKNPGFTLVAILTLAIGIGANTGMFSIVYGILLRPLPFEEANRLVVIDAERDVRGARVPVPTFFAASELDTFRRRASFESVAFYATDAGALSSPTGSERVDFATVSDSFFPTLRGQLKLGRSLGPSDDLAPSIAISERLWRRAFGGSPDVLGQSVVLSSLRGDGSQRALWRRTPFTIVGVVDSGFQFPAPQTDVWTTTGFVRTITPRCCSFVPVARLKPGVTIGEANHDIESVARGLSASGGPAYAGLRTNVVGLHDRLVQAVRPSLRIVLAAVGLVLFVACANVTNLLLARNAARTREIAVRRALGASRRRLIGQLIVESAVLAAMGSAGGMALAAAIVETLQQLAPAGLPRLDAVHVDAPVFLFAVVAAALATLVTGVLPSLHATSVHALKTGVTTAMTSRRGARTRRALVTAELAVSVVLLVGTVLLARSLIHLIRGDLGVITDRVATASLGLAVDRDLPAAEQVILVNRVLNRIRSLPGVVSAGIGTSLPPGQSRMILTLRGANDAIDYQASAIPTTTGFFQALGIRLLRGRFFTETDDGDHPQVMIMSADTARQTFGDGDPIGRTRLLPVIRDGKTTNATMTLVGVIENVKYSGLERGSGHAIYRPFAQQPWPNVFLVARTQGNPAQILMPLPREIAGIDRRISVSAVSSLETVILAAAAQPRFRAVLLGAICGLGLLLAAVGLYGVISYSVSQRTNEIGVRMALGASTRQVTGMMIREGATLALGGLVLGAGGAYIVARAMRTVLYGVRPGDTLSFVMASGCLLLVALVATYIPARRAARIDPIVALRCE